MFCEVSLLAKLRPGDHNTIISENMIVYSKSDKNSHYLLIYLISWNVFFSKWFLLNIIDYKCKALSKTWTIGIYYNILYWEGQKYHMDYFTLYLN